MLIGRKDDIRQISNLILDKPLVVLSGASGVGKSSLVMNGLVENLGVLGFDVLVARKWGLEVDASGTDVEELLTRLLLITHTDPSSPTPAPEGIDLGSLTRPEGRFEAPHVRLSEQLDTRYDDDLYAVVVLDQFEELLRKDRDLAARLIGWATEAGYSHSYHVLVALRSDSTHLLDPLLHGRGHPGEQGFIRGPKPFSLDRIELAPIKETAAVTSIIQTVKEPPGAQVEMDLATDLVTTWQHLVKAGHVPSLLELQATLYSLYFLAPETTDGLRVLGKKALERFRAKVPDGTSLFAAGLQMAVDLKLKHLESASKDYGLDAFLVEGTMELVRRAARLLSSGGFKVPMQEREFVRRVLDRERDGLRVGLAKEAAASGTAEEDLTSVLLDDLLSTKDVLSEPNRFKDAQALVRGLTAGPMMGRSATATLFEELRRAVFAIRWLETGGLLKRELEGTLLLVHDGAGPALAAWAAKRGGTETRGDSTACARRQLVAANGATYDWRDTSAADESRWALDGGEVGHEVVANLSWRNCRITGRFRTVVFVNCDFTGSLFIDCELRGVTFVNCLLDDVNFEDCVLSGERGFDPIPVQAGKGDDAEVGRLAPSFVVAVDPAEVDHFCFYAQGDQAIHGSLLFSDTSGLPVSLDLPNEGVPRRVLANLVPDGLDDDGLPSEYPPVRPATSGATVIGGRVCFLTLYRFTSSDGSAFALHHVSGNGVDLVAGMTGDPPHPSQSKLEIHDGAIRGISVSRDLLADSGFEAHGATVSTDPKVALKIAYSLVQNVYFAAELSGEANVKDSAVIMLINAGDNALFPVRVLNSRFQFVANVEELTGDPEGTFPELARRFEPADGVGGAFHLPNRRELAYDLEKMDYRANPAAWEEGQRERRRMRAAGRSSP